jgi:hypothetical protein
MREMIIVGIYPASIGKTVSFIDRIWSQKQVVIEMHGNRAKRRRDAAAVARCHKTKKKY